MLTWMQVSQSLFSMIQILAALFLLLLVLFFIIPLNISFEFRKRGPMIQASYKIIWLGVAIKKGYIEPTAADEASSIDAPAHSSSHTLDIKSLVDAILAIILALKDLCKSINFKKASCSLSFGLNDPAQTAVICGYLWSLAAATGPLSTSIHIEPCFQEGRLEGEIKVELGARMLWTSVALINSLREKKIRKLLIMIIRETLS